MELLIGLAIGIVAGFVAGVFVYRNNVARLGRLADQVDEKVAEVKKKP